MTPVLQWALPLALIMLALAMGCALLRMLKGPSPKTACWRWTAWR